MSKSCAVDMPASACISLHRSAISIATWSRRWRNRTQPLEDLGLMSLMVGVSNPLGLVTASAWFWLFGVLGK